MPDVNTTLAGRVIINSILDLAKKLLHTPVEVYLTTLSGTNMSLGTVGDIAIIIITYQDESAIDFTCFRWSSALLILPVR